MTLQCALQCCVQVLYGDVHAATAAIAHTAPQFSLQLLVQARFGVVLASDMLIDIMAFVTIKYLEYHILLIKRYLATTSTSKIGN